MSYSEFVNEEKLSNTAKCNAALSHRLLELDVRSNCNHSRLLNGAIGAASESAELLEVVAYGIPKEKAIDELGDVLFYLAVTAEAIGMVDCLVTIRPSNIYDIFCYSDIRDVTKKLSIANGKYLDIVKKIVFLGKDFTDNILKLQEAYYNSYELVLVCCRLLDVSVDEVQQINMDKLNGRYKNGFSVLESENKK